MTPKPNDLTPHVSLDTIAVALEGLPGPGDAEAVNQHLAVCEDCSALADELNDTRDFLRDAASPPMPEHVADRLTATVRGESERRAAGISEAEEAAEAARVTKRMTFGSFDPHPFGAKAYGEKTMPRDHQHHQPERGTGPADG